MIRFFLAIFCGAAFASAASAQHPRQVQPPTNPQGYAAVQSEAAQQQQKVADTNAAINNTKVATAPQGRAP